MARRRRFRLSSQQAVDLDGEIYASLYATWVRWEKGGGTIPPCPAPTRYHRLLPAEVRRSGDPGAEVAASIKRLKGRRLVNVIRNRWRPSGPEMCLVPFRAAPGEQSVAGSRKRRRRPRRN